MLLIRHARAGERSEWDGDDRRRPLDERGRLQAERLVELLAAHDVTRVLSSPYDRCVQTVEPLARNRGVVIDPREELGEELQESVGATLVRSVLDETVAVSCHGGLAEAVVGESQKKGETFVLRSDGERLVIVARIRS